MNMIIRRYLFIPKLRYKLRARGVLQILIQVESINPNVPDWAKNCMVRGRYLNYYISGRISLVNWIGDMVGLSRRAFVAVISEGRGQP